MDNIIEIKIRLENIAKKMQFIEDKDDDFSQNEKWQELNKQQNYCYLQLAEWELEFYKSYNDSNPKQFKQDKIDLYTNYIKNNLNKNKEKGNEIDETKLF